MDGYVDISTVIPNMNITDTQIHPEEYGNSKFNTVINSGIEDIKTIDNNIKTFGSKVNNILTNTIDRLEIVYSTIIAEKERLQDITMLCNEKTDYDNVISLTDTDFTGNFTYSDGVFSAKESSSVSTECKVINITGNGYEGNKYVLKDNKYLEETLPTDNRNYITDNNISSYWEYSRITAANTEEYLISDFNTDSSEAKCTITLQFGSITNQLLIKSSLNNIKVTDIRYSNNNIDYTDCNIDPFLLNNKETSYKGQGYIYGSNIISFPNSLYLKITFESTAYLNDVIAFERVIAINNKTDTNTTIVSSAKRHVIRINDIISKQKQYITNSVFKTDELIKDKKNIYAISVFANYYLPDNSLTEDYIKFTLIINGIDYDIKPINSYSNGIKIIRFSQGKVPTIYTQYIGEKITSAYLTINIKSKTNLTPYINNLKILLGGVD